MRRLRERQSVSLAVPAKDEPTDVGCVMLLAEGDTALLQTVDPGGIEIVDPVDGVAVLGFQHDNRLVMLRGTARQLTPSLFSFQVMDGVGVRQLRGRTRLPVRVPVVVSAHGATEIHGCTTDLSCSGAALELRVPPLGPRFTLTLQLPDGGEPLVVEADVVRQTPAGPAVHFSEISHDLALRIESFILTEKARAVWLAA